MNSSGSNKLVLVDGNAIMHRAFHALPPLTSPRGESVNAVYGFVSMLIRIFIDLKPTHIAVCFDRKEPTFRKKEFKEYQAHRPEMDKDLIPQFPKAREVAKALDIPVYDKAGFEADDLIGTIATKTSKNKSIDQVIIVTGDKDIFQLISDKVKVYLPIKGLSVAKMMGEEEVVEKLGVRPDQIVDYKALVGDPSDNYKGVPGIGPKTAIKLLDEFDTKKNIYKNIDKIEGRTKDLLVDNKESADMSEHLAQIVTNVSFDFSLDEMNKWQVDSGKVMDLFDGFGLRTLKRRIIDLGKSIQSEKQGSLF